VISLDWTLWLQFGNFFVLLVLLNVILYKPLRRKMEERRSLIDGSYESAKNMQEQVDAKMEEYEGKLQLAKLKASEETAALRENTKEEESTITTKAQQIAVESVKAIKEKVAVEADKARAALQVETEAIAGSIATKVLGRKL